MQSDTGLGKDWAAKRQGRGFGYLGSLIGDVLDEEVCVEIAVDGAMTGDVEVEKSAEDELVVGVVVCHAACACGDG